MSAEFFETTIGDQVTLQRGFDITKKDQVDGDVPVVSSGGISSFHNKAMVAGPGVVLGRKGSLGTVFYVPEDFWPHDTSLWVRDFKGNNPRFVYYFFRNISEVLKKMDVGAANPALNRNHVHPLPAKWTNRETQDSIVSIVSSLDDKIELNRQINQTLEQIAQTIFKSWFVDFEPVKAKIEARTAGHDPERAAMCAISSKLESELDQLPPEQYQKLAATTALFPDELVESELGLIPVGWEVVTLDSLSTKISKGTTPTKQDIASAADDPLIPFIKVKDIGEDGELNRDGIDKIPDTVHRGALKRSILNASDILFSIAGTIGRIAVVEKDLQNSNANQAVAFVRLKNCDAHLGLCLQFLKSQRLQDAANAAIVQGVQANLSLGSLGGFKILLPSKDVLAEWNNKYRSLFDETRCLAGETRTLATLRDTLLPKLLSGEISLAESSLSVEGAINA